MYTMTVDGEKLYDPTLTEYIVEAPRLEQEANRHGTLSFTLHEGNPRYGQIRNMLSVVRLYRDGQIIGAFRPCKIRLTFRNGLEYTCEELTALLNDVLRRPKAYEGDARGLIQECISDATTLSGDTAIYRPSVQYFREILDSNQNFRYLNADSQIGDLRYESTAQGDGQNIWPDKYTVSAHYTKQSVNPTYWGNHIDDLLKALAALGYMGKTYVPGTTSYPTDGVGRFCQTHGIELWRNQVDCSLASIWQSLKKSGIFGMLLQEMREFIADLPATDTDWDEEVTGWPVVFALGDTPASDSLDNGWAADKQRLEFGENDYQGYWDYLQDNLIEPYGGYLVPVWTSDTICTLNYMRDEDLPRSSQVIEFGENMTDLFIDSDCEAAYSTVIPLGKDGLTISAIAPNNQDFLTDGEAYQLYGRREIVKEWPEISIRAALYQAAMNWMLTKSLALKDSISVNAYDLRYSGVDVEYLTFMENVAIVSRQHNIDDMIPIKAVSISLDSPASDTFELSREPESIFDEDDKKSSLTDKVSKAQKNIRTIGGHQALIPQG